MLAFPLIGVGFVSAFLSSLILTWVIRDVARKMGAVDDPDGIVKHHSGPTPNVGGVAVFLATALALAASLLGGGIELWAPHVERSQLVALAGAGVMVWALGLLDDLRGLGPWTRFLTEFAIAGLLVAVGIRIDVLGMLAGGAITLPVVVAVPATLVWIVGITNAFNLLDGSDGVAGGAALIALLTLGALSLWWGQVGAALTCFVLAGAVLGFLFFNFPPASIFLGDSGSLFLGFSLASLGILTTQEEPTLLAIAIPVLAFGVPVLDTVLAVVRRLLRGQPIFKADRGHIHHRLRELGHSPRNVAILLWALAAVLCGLAMVVAGGEAQTAAIALGLVACLVVLFVQRLRIPELLEFARIVRLSGARRARIDRSVRLRRAAEFLSSARTPEDVLRGLRLGFEGGEFSHVEFWLGDVVGRPFAELVSVESTLHGFEVPVVRRTDGGGGSDLEIRLSVLDETGSRLADLTLVHGAAGGNLTTDLGLVRKQVVPALRRAILNLDATGPISSPPLAAPDSHPPQGVDAGAEESGASRRSIGEL